MRWMVLGGVSIMGALAELWLEGRPATRRRVIEVLLLWIFAVAVGVNGVYSFLGHFFLADQVAAYIRWPAGNPFQTEVAFANLAIGTLGLLCIRYRGDFWLATGLATCIWLTGARPG